MDDTHFSSPFVSFVSFVVKVFGFPMSAMSAILRPSACVPQPRPHPP